MYIAGQLKQGIRDYLIIDSPTAQAYKGFVNNLAGDEPPTHLLIYVWNITNSEEILRNSSAKPIIKQCGPYWYWPLVIKFQLSWQNDTSLIRYKEWDSYYFDRTLSAGDDQLDIVTSVNVPFQGVYKALHSTFASLSRCSLSLYRSMSESLGF